MNIAYISSSEWGCPTPANQIQAAIWVAAQVIEGMTKRGHTTTYIGVNGSTVGASRILSMGPAFFDLYSYTDWVMLPTAQKDQTMNNYQTALQMFFLDQLKTEHFDVIHYHTSPPIFMLPFSRSINIPKVQTFHDPLEWSYKPLFRQYSDVKSNHYISISNAQRNGAEYIPFTDTVYNGIDIAQYPFSKDGGEELLFLGRFKKIKGVHTAIQVALKAGIPITVAGREARTEIDFLKKEVDPYVDGIHVKKVGMISHHEIDEIIGKSKALLFPIEWEEPFGLVMIEAMACGTPVIAYNRGSVSEIVKDGVTGFIVDDDESSKSQVSSSNNFIIKKRGIEGLVEAVGRIGEIDRGACRKHVEENFTVEKMVEGYERVYTKIFESR